MMQYICFFKSTEVNDGETATIVLQILVFELVSDFCGMGFAKGLYFKTKSNFGLRLLHITRRLLFR